MKTRGAYDEIQGWVNISGFAVHMVSIAVTQTL